MWKNGGWPFSHSHGYFCPLVLALSPVFFMLHVQLMPTVLLALWEAVYDRLHWQAPKLMPGPHQQSDLWLKWQAIKSNQHLQDKRLRRSAERREGHNESLKARKQQIPSGMSSVLSYLYHWIHWNQCIDKFWFVKFSLVIWYIQVKSHVVLNSNSSANINYITFLNWL